MRVPLAFVFFLHRVKPLNSKRMPTVSAIASDRTVTPQKYVRMAAFAKRVMPVVSRVLVRGPIVHVVRAAEMGCALLQGKGAGSGWDIDAEIAAALGFVRTECPVLMDIGANQGDWTRSMSVAFPRARALILVEPQEVCLEKLRVEFPSATIISCAVSDGSSSGRPFYTAGPGWAAASIYARRDSYFAEENQRAISVPLTTIDAILADHSIEGEVDFMKMDIEGAELEALRGAARALHGRRIRTLSFEFGSGNINSRTFFRDFWDLLTPLGYRIYRIKPGGGLLHIAGYYEDLEYFRGVSNYIASLC